MNKIIEFLDSTHAPHHIGSTPVRFNGPVPIGQWSVGKKPRGLRNSDKDSENSDSPRPLSSFFRRVINTGIDSRHAGKHGNALLGEGHGPVPGSAPS